MILVMAYAALLSACLAAVAAALEPICRALRAPNRWVWVWGLGLSLVATAGVMFLPSRDLPELAAPDAVLAAPVPMIERDMAPDPFADRMWQRAGIAASLVWAGSSLLLLIGLAGGAWRLARERRVAGRSHVQGHFVLLTDGVGPAVAGVRDPVALIPRWVLELDETSQRLLLAHEMEHVRARDSALLVLGALMAALLPWNPTVWWMLRRLRLAVELDCDQRVLSRGGGVRRYAELLLMTARMPSEHARALVAGLGEDESDLERRILAMTESNQSSMRPLLSRAVLPAALASALIFAACETPRPDPVGPSTLGLNLTEREVPADVREVEVPTELLAELRKALREMEGSSLRIDEIPNVTSRIDEMRTATKKMQELLDRLEPDSSAVKLRESPYELQGIEPKAVRRGVASPAGKIVMRDPTRMVELTPASARAQAAPLEIQVLSSDGRVLATEHHKSTPASPAWLTRVDPQQIEHIEIVKRAVPCLAQNASGGDGCNRVTITLKPGQTLRAR